MWHAVVLVLLSTALSCEKGGETTLLHTQEKQSLSTSKDLYKQLKVGDRMRDTLRAGIVVSYVPQWEKVREYQKNDSSHHTVVPLLPIVSKDGVAVNAKTVTDFPFLFILNGTHFYFGRFFTPKDDDNYTVDMDSIFVNGEMELTEVFTNQIIHYHYENGSGVHIKPQTKNRLSAKRSPKSAYELRCYTETTCTWFADCQGGVYLATSPLGTCSQPPTTTPCDYSAQWQRSTDIRREVCEYVWVPDPIEPSPGPDTPSTPIKTQKENILANLKLSDCHRVKRANEIAKNVKVQDAIKTIKGKSKEWGVQIKLTDPNDPKSFTVGTPYEGASNRSFL